VDALKQSFHRFFKQFMAQSPEVTPKGSGGKALSRFSGAAQHSNVEVPLLLIDSEGPAPHPDEMSFKQFLSRKGQRSKNKRLLADIREGQIFLMVQCMEAWFLADKDGLANYYRRGGNQFDPSNLPPFGNESIENVDKDIIFERITEALQKADRHKPKEKRRSYEHRHGFEILGYIDPHKVVAASPHAKRLFDALTQLSGK